MTDTSELYILDNLQTKTFKVNNKLWNYLNSLTTNLNTNKFKYYFKKTMSMYIQFKNNNITNQNKLSDYFRRCQFLSILQMMGMFTNSLPQFGTSTGIIKIGPSKDGKKNCCIIDDSTIIDKDTNEIRDTNGSIDEHHRGHRLFNMLSTDYQEDVILVFDYMIHYLKNLLVFMNNKQYIMFDPIYMMQQIVHYCVSKNMVHFIHYLASEIHDTSYSLSYEEKLNLFKDYDFLHNLWYNNFITNNHGKLRIFILCLFYIYLLNSEET
jgi:hypothetical protein